MNSTYIQHPRLYVQLRFDLRKKEVRGRYKNLWQFQVFNLKAQTLKNKKQNSQGFP